MTPDPDLFRSGQLSGFVGGRLAKWHALIKQCPHGHRYTKQNTYINKNDGSRNCKKCAEVYHKSSKGKRIRQQRAQARQVWINDYLSIHPCIDCGETDPLVLVFDHCRRKKYRDVTGLNLMSLKKVLEEIKKCDVVCANDHARRTAKRANTIRWQLNK